jgi:hypothetical protein
MDTTGTTRQFIVKGAIAGLVAGVVMAMYAMVASATFLGQGFFTPMYGIASPIVGPQAMMTSMQQGIYFVAGPALLGPAIHMMWAALYGVIFGLIARAAHLTGAAAVVAGIVYGLLVMLFMSFVVLPIVGAGAMPGMVGWTSFTIEHMVFGLVLGLWPALRPEDVPLATAQGLPHQRAI